jgi:hypothetical protein
MEGPIRSWWKCIGEWNDGFGTVVEVRGVAEKQQGWYGLNVDAEVASSVTVAGRQAASAAISSGELWLRETSKIISTLRPPLHNHLHPP